MKTLRSIAIAALFVAAFGTQKVYAQLESNKNDEVLQMTEQPYSTAIGLRAGGTSGVTLKHFFGASSAGEAIFSFWPNSFGVTGLYEHYTPTGLEGMNWYYGGGAHFAVATGKVYRGFDGNRYYVYRDDAYPGFGVGLDGIVGAEYKIPRIPFAFSLDVKPFMELSNAGTFFMALDPGFQVKFTF